jgi:hypothetical protein
MPCRKLVNPAACQFNPAGDVQARGQSGQVDTVADVQADAGEIVWQSIQVSCPLEIEMIQNTHTIPGAVF